MRTIPSHLNLVRITGLGVTVRTPRGFRRVDSLPGDSNKYAVREGYRLAACPGVIHKKGGFSVGCEHCDPFHGAVAVKI